MLFTPKLKEAGYLQDVSFHLFQVGSRKNDRPEGFEQQRWPVLGKQLSIYGFEADPEGCAAANAQAQQADRPWREKHFPERSPDRWAQPPFTSTPATLSPPCSWTASKPWPPTWRCLWFPSCAATSRLA
ncbi:MAG: hypothetical protein HC918_08305 [Oscillatoriales cyanobacterium SM2_1_8]|nr:hypothetical protein [Oscillatoriales cyanobacterium SM2_1_8]